MDFTQKKIWLVSSIIVLAMFLVGAGAYYVGLTMNKKSPSPTPSSSPSVQPTPTETINPITDPGVNWLPKPEKLNDLQLFNAEAYPSESVSYYKVADIVNAGQLIDAQIQIMGIALYRFRKDFAGTYHLIVKNSDFSSTSEQDIQNSLSDLLDKEKHDNKLIRIDYQTIYSSLVAPQTLTFQNKTVKIASAGFDRGQLFDTVTQNLEQAKISNPTYKEIIEKIGSTTYGDVYRDLRWNESSNPKVKNVNYILKLADTSIIRYASEKYFLADDGTLIATLSDKDFSSKKFTIGFIRGCGGPIDTFYDDSSLSSRLVPIGLTSSGEPLYTLTDATNDILKIAYENYNGGRVDDKSVLSYESFVAKKPILIWKDPFNNYLIFADSDFGPLAECGKPVIYLYPEKTTSVSVKIGAEIKISKPGYLSGWKVTANSDGSIIDRDGKSYDSLYWEGIGNGFYPFITQGRVVSSKSIQTELQSDLTALGLNKKESADFMSFWLPRMPKTPYVRLTWLTTKEMNALAPLSVSPRPETVARIFLDFQGQNDFSTNLTPQKLTGFQRKGFTLVEWGGLLIGKP